MEHEIDRKRKHKQRMANKMMMMKKKGTEEKRIQNVRCCLDVHTE